MGMYTRLTFWADLPADSPAVPVIQALLDGTAVPDTGEGFPRMQRAGAIFRCSSYYHRTGETVFRYDDIARAWWLNIDSSLKNYEGEITAFLDWIVKYDCGEPGFRGFYLYEEDEQPTLLYLQDGAWSTGGPE